MAEKRADADKKKHPALVYIEKHGMTRKQAAEALGVPDKLVMLNHVLDRFKGTTDRWKVLFHDVFGIPMEDLVGIEVRPDAATFKKQQRKKGK